ncbi:MAG: hypothetical protein U0587_11515 [Candidatus Binatia bacterium]
MMRRAALCLGLSLLAGCVVVPTIPHGIGAVVDRKTRNSFQPGTSTRADVLLALGDPPYRFQDDRFFMYAWDVAYGYVGVAYAGGAPLRAFHYLCLEFGPDGVLVRRKEIVNDWDKAISACMNPEAKDT